MRDDWADSTELALAEDGRDSLTREPWGSGEIAALAGALAPAGMVCPPSDASKAPVHAADDASGVGSARRTRCVLVIASRFPPVASVGATRVRKFVKYLGRHGWHPVVITGAMRRGQANAQDARRATDMDSLLDLPAGIEVHRLSGYADHWPTYLSRDCATMLASYIPWLGLDRRRLETGLKWRLTRIHDRLSFPDRGIWRLPLAVRLAKRLHKQHHFDAVFSSGMPFSDHMIGLAVQNALRLPWLADFRDPWVEYIHWRQWQGAWGQLLTRWAERAVCRRASYVISVNDHMTRRFAQRYRKRPSRKFVTIGNGFDPDDFHMAPITTERKEFRLLYAGSLYKTRSPEHVLEAFRKFTRDVPGSREHAWFDFAGRSGPHFEELQRLSQGENVRYLGMLPHAAALEAMMQADVNVIILPKLPGSENDTTAKLYECLGSGRPVLAAVPLDGAAARELRQHDGVVLCDPEDVDGIAKGIESLYCRWLSGALEPRRSPESLMPHTRQHQAGVLAACLDTAVRSRSKPMGAHHEHHY